MRKIGSPDPESLAVHEAQTFADEQHIFLQQNDNSRFQFQITPPLPQKPSASVPVNEETSLQLRPTRPRFPQFIRLFSSFKPPRLAKLLLFGSGRHPPGEKALRWLRMMQTLQALPSGASWFHPQTEARVNDLLLEADYAGDVARLTSKEDCSPITSTTECAGRSACEGFVTGLTRRNRTANPATAKRLSYLS